MWLCISIFCPCSCGSRVCARLLKVGSWAALCVCVCVWRWVDYDCWLELVFSSVECLEWWVILVLFTKWNSFCQLIKFGRKYKNTWETWVMSFFFFFFFFLSLPPFSIILSKVILLPHRLWSPSVTIGRVRRCTLLSLTFTYLHTSPSVACLTLTAAKHVWQPCPGLDWCPSSILFLQQLVVSLKLAFLTAVDTTGRGFWERAWRKYPDSSCFLEESDLIAKISTEFCCPNHIKINMWNERSAVMPEDLSILLNKRINLQECGSIPQGSCFSQDCTLCSLVWLWVWFWICFFNNLGFLL